MTRSRALGTAAVALALLTPAAAQAATPETGTVTGQDPVLSYTGEAPAFLTNNVRFFGDLAGETLVGCEAALGCDTFTLTLAEKGKLEITIDNGVSYADVTVVEPGGNEVVDFGNGDSGVTKYTRVGAPAGEYLVQVQNGDFQAPIGEGGAYSGLVELNDGKVTPPPAG